MTLLHLPLLLSHRNRGPELRREIVEGLHRPAAIAKTHPPRQSRPLPPLARKICPTALPWRGFDGKFEVRLRLT